VIKKYTVLKKSYAQAWQIEPKVSIGLQPLPSIHLHSHFLDEIEPNGNIQIVYIFMITAALILLVACINYVNIALARSTKRFKEVGMRKILGADKKQITTQFLIESSLSLFLAMGVAILLVELGLPLFTELAGKPLDVNYWQYITYLLPLLLTVGLLSSLYPAVILGSFAPAQAIKNLTHIKSIKGASIRKALQTFQFVIATLLIICTGTIYQQLSYIKVKNLGFRKDQILLISLQSPELQVKHQLLKDALLKNPGVLKVAASHTTPGSEFTGVPYRLPIGAEKNSLAHLEGYPTLFIDADYLSLMDIPIVAGRDFSKENILADEKHAVIINESAVRAFGYQHPQQALANKIDYWDQSTRSFISYSIIGVVKDFHYESLHNKISPLLLRLPPSNERIRTGYAESMTNLSVLFSTDNIPATLSALSHSWKEIEQVYPFEYTFLDQKLSRLYKSEEQMSQTFVCFSFISLFLTCIGLFGISILSVEQRRKEIGIRKVLGANVLTIVIILSKDFLKLILIANLFAWPIAWWIMGAWLQNFAYRVTANPMLFLLSTILSICIALLTISLQTIKAAIENPVNSLRIEH
jgi:putative ABC transport system permease protein